jgi:hypothetical protein
MRCIGQEVQRGLMLSLEGWKNPAFGGANRRLGCVAAFARYTASRCKPRLPETPIGRHQTILISRTML